MQMVFKKQPHFAYPQKHHFSTTWLLSLLRGELNTLLTFFLQKFPNNLHAMCYRMPKLPRYTITEKCLHQPFVQFSNLRSTNLPFQSLLHFLDRSL